MTQSNVMSETKTILVADGSQPTIPDMKPALDAIGYKVIMVADALYVLTMARRHSPAAVVLGVRLPGGGAATAVRRLRSSVHTASIPVIALTEPGEQKQALLSMGAQECLEPPVSESEILNAISRCLGVPQKVTEAPSRVIADPKRLSALNSTGLLDTEPDAALDVVTRLTANVLKTPVALVSLVDHDRQFFKSQVGLPHPWDESRQTPLSHSFCQWVVASQEELVVSDARTHPVLRDNGAVADLAVVAYAGAPLVSRSGEFIGSFCAIDSKVRHWTEDERATLRDFSQIVDAHTALYQSDNGGAQLGENDLLKIASAAGRGFLGATRLLQRNRPAIGPDERDEILAIIERHSHRLVEVLSRTSVV